MWGGPAEPGGGQPRAGGLEEGVHEGVEEEGVAGGVAVAVDGGLDAEVVDGGSARDEGGCPKL